MRLGGLILPEHPGPRAPQVWQYAEQLGLAHAWTYDHLSWRTLRESPWFEAMTTLASAAAVTRTIGLGTLVASPHFRHPVLCAKQAMTLDQLSGGRFTLGLGAGGPGADAEVLGTRQLSQSELADRFEEFTRLCDLLLRAPEVTFHGRWYDAVDARSLPGCVQRPRLPFAVAATGPRGMRLAARYAATWVTVGDARALEEQDERAAFAALRAQSGRLAAACAAEGRDPATLRRLAVLSRFVPDPYSSPGRLAELLGRLAELGVTDAVIALPRPDGVFAGDRAAFERAVGQCSGG
ncbi:LLM class flavin-dependent oxidoreductase [Kitasatospora kifunensis]|uniref:LLM class flavin-dependent oxidoreductase n=1 Tax=Kitasatospora kifunensis TaxID=58351 RepID=UPI001622E34D|nr:LLM class flavin-dependent oxidoreductase [Kitasatospora kifunensis]